MRVPDVLALAALLLAGCGGGPSARPAAPDPSGPHVRLPDGSSIAVEVASDPETRARGLMYRPALPADRGMLFLFPEPAVHAFWMKNTLIPLDIIWIDANGRVVDLAAAVPPCEADPCPSYTPAAEASAVLELAAGEAARRGVVPGSTLAIRNVERFVVR